MSEPNVITPERLDAIEDEAHKAMQRAWDQGLAADGTLPMVCAALRVAWSELDGYRKANREAAQSLVTLDRQLGQLTEAALIYLDALASTPHDGPQLAARGRLAMHARRPT